MDYRRIELGTVEFIFDADIKFKTHRRSAARFIAKVSRHVEAGDHDDISVGGYSIPLSAIFIDPSSMEPGSLKAIGAVVGIMAGAATIVANYSELKEEIPIIMEDIREFAEGLSKEADHHGPPSKVLYPQQVATIPRSTDEILRDLNLDRRRVRTRDHPDNLVMRD